MEEERRPGTGALTRLLACLKGRMKEKEMKQMLLKKPLIRRL